MNGVRRYRNGQSSVAGLGCRIADARAPVTGRVARRRAAVERADQRAGRERGRRLAVHLEQRLVAERVVEHLGELGDQPVVAVVVVEHEDAVLGEVVAHAGERLLGEQERLEPELALLADQRQRVGQREDDEVVLLVGRAQERAAVVDVAGDARVGVRLVGVVARCRSAGVAGRSRPRRCGRRPSTARSPRPSRCPRRR